MKRRVKKAGLLLSAAVITTAACTSFSVNASDDQNIQNDLSLSKITGDLNNDGTTDLQDLTMMSQYLLKDISLNFQQLTNADVDRSGAIDLTDLVYYKQYICHDPNLSSSVKIGEVYDKFWIVRDPIPDSFPETVIIPGAEGEQPVPPLTEEDIDVDDKFVIEREPMPVILPVNAENNNYNYAVFSGKTYSKRGAFIFSKDQIDESSQLAFIIEDAETLSGTMAAVKTLTGISIEDVLLLKCGETEGKYYMFMNQKIDEEGAGAYFDKFGITDHTTPDIIDDPVFEQPVPVMNQ